MSLKKALAILLAIFVLTLVVCFLVQAFLPNPATAFITHFLTVDLIPYIQSKLEWVALTIGGITATIGGALRSVNKTKEVAKTQVANANQQVIDSNSNVNALLTENKLQADKLTALSTENEALKTNQTEAQNKLIPLQTENERLKTQVNWYQDLVKVNGIKADPTDPRVIEATTPTVQ